MRIMVTTHSGALVFFTADEAPAFLRATAGVACNDGDW